MYFYDCSKIGKYVYNARMGRRVCVMLFQRKGLFSVNLLRVDGPPTSLYSYRQVYTRVVRCTHEPATTIEGNQTRKKKIEIKSLKLIDVNAFFGDGGGLLPYRCQTAAIKKRAKLRSLLADEFRKTIENTDDLNQFTLLVLEKEEKRTL